MNATLWKDCTDVLGELSSNFRTGGLQKAFFKHVAEFNIAFGGKEELVGSGMNMWGENAARAHGGVGDVEIRA